MSDLSSLIADQWQPIPPETLIKEAMNGKQVLVYENGRYYNAWLEFDEYVGGWLWMDDADSEPSPSHWMPLPSPPRALQQKGPSNG